MREDSARSAELCARDNRYCEDAATLGRTCAVDVPFTWRCVAFESRFPKTHRPMRQGRMTIGTHTTPTSRSTDDIYQLNATRTPPQTSPLSANLFRNGLQTDYWRMCCHWTRWAAANGGLMIEIDAPPSGRARPFRCHGYVEWLLLILRTSDSFPEALEDVRAIWGCLANSQLQVSVSPLATVGGTVRNYRPFQHCSMQHAPEIAA